MDARQRTVAESCLQGAYDDTISFPDGVRLLAEAGFEGYLVDYRRNTRTHYMADGETLVLDNPHPPHAIATEFDRQAVQATIRWAQERGPGYSYAAFNTRVMDHGCAGYLAAFEGRRVLYFGRTGETHTEHFPT